MIGTQKPESPVEVLPHNDLPRGGRCGGKNFQSAALVSERRLMKADWWKEKGGESEQDMNSQMQEKTEPPRCFEIPRETGNIEKPR